MSNSRPTRIENECRRRLALLGLVVTVAGDSDRLLRAYRQQLNTTGQVVIEPSVVTLTHNWRLNPGKCQQLLKEITFFTAILAEIQRCWWWQRPALA